MVEEEMRERAEEIIDTLPPAVIWERNRKARPSLTVWQWVSTPVLVEEARTIGGFQFWPERDIGGKLTGWWAWKKEG